MSPRTTSFVVAASMGAAITVAGLILVRYSPVERFAWIFGLAAISGPLNFAIFAARSKLVP